MSGSLNKVQVIGNLGRDPEIRYTSSNEAIANVTVATSEKWKGKDGQQQEKTEWHRVVVFGKLAGVIEKYLKKGDEVYFEGKLQTRKWQDKEGQDRYTTEIVVNGFGGTMVMLGSKGGNAGGSSPAATNQDEGFSDEIPF